MLAETCSSKFSFHLSGINDTEEIRFKKRKRKKNTRLFHKFGIFRARAGAGAQFFTVDIINIVLVSVFDSSSLALELQLEIIQSTYFSVCSRSLALEFQLELIQSTYFSVCSSSLALELQLEIIQSTYFSVCSLSLALEFQ